jgi:hypothetical protein
VKPIAVAAFFLGCSVAIGTGGAAFAAETEAEAEANRVAHDHLLCRKYGYEETSDAFAHCLDVLAGRRAEAAAKASADRRKATSQQRALSSAESSACATRSEVVNGGSRQAANPHEGSGTCGH